MPSLSDSRIRGNGVQGRLVANLRFLGDRFERDRLALEHFAEALPASPPSFRRQQTMSYP